MTGGVSDAVESGRWAWVPDKGGVVVVDVDELMYAPSIREYARQRNPSLHEAVVELVERSIEMLCD